MRRLSSGGSCCDSHRTLASFLSALSRDCSLFSCDGSTSRCAALQPQGVTHMCAVACSRRGGRRRGCAALARVRPRHRRAPSAPAERRGDARGGAARPRAGHARAGAVDADADRALRVRPPALLPALCGAAAPRAERRARQRGRTAARRHAAAAARHAGAGGVRSPARRRRRARGARARAPVDGAASAATPLRCCRCRACTTAALFGALCFVHAARCPAGRSFRRVAGRLPSSAGRVCRRAWRSRWRRRCAQPGA